MTEQQETVSEANIHAIATLPPDLAVMKIENESIMALAAVRPRSMIKMKTALTDILNAFPVLARESIYNVAVGKDNKTGQQKFARNLSIRAAETLREVFGFTSVRAEVTILSDDLVKVTGIFTDYQTGNVTSIPSIISKYYKQANTGKMIRIPEDRFFKVTVKGEMSKVIRDAITRSMNAGLKKWYWNECEKVIDATLDTATMEKIVSNFSNKGVSLEQIEKLLGKTWEGGWTKEDRKHLAGIWTAIEEEETIVGEVFGEQNKKEPEPPKADLGASKAKMEDRPNGQAKPAEDKDIPEVVTNIRELIRTAKDQKDLGATAGLALNANVASLGIHYSPLLQEFQKRYKELSGAAAGVGS